MLRFLKRLLLTDPTADWARVVQDPVLGELRLNEDATWWDAAVPLSGGRVLRFRVGGEGEPAPALVAHAREIASGFTAFEGTVRAFLAAEAAKRPDLAGEVPRLEIDTVCLLWPERPGDGEIEFRGPDPSRLRVCGIKDGLPVNLGLG